MVPAGFAEEDTACPLGLAALMTTQAPQVFPGTVLGPSQECRDIERLWC